MQKIPKNQDELKEFIKSLPQDAGVYKFVGTKKVPIYIGKSKNIKKRVTSYFSDNKNKSKKIVNLRHEAKFLDLTITNTELDALLLEQHLIKEEKPKFNVQFKDDKGYPWIRIESSKEFPSAKSFLGKKEDKEKYFGPYPSSYAVREALSLIQKTFKLRNCSDSFFRNRTRPCMQYEIGRCSAPCVGYISKVDYLEEVKSTQKLLEGESEELMSHFYSLMDKSSKSKSYERAALYRDKISALRDIQRNQSIAGYSKERDAISVGVINGVTRIGITHVNKGWITGHKNFIQKNKINIEESVIGAFIKGHYLSNSKCPAIIVTNENLLDKVNIEKALSKQHGRKIRIITRPRKKDQGLLDISKANTKLIPTKDSRKGEDLSYVLKSLKEYLDLPRSIGLIESYDISHHSGSGAVGGCVVYSISGKLKDKYRLFNISKKNSGDDIASMKEVLTRRFSNKGLGLEKPNLILIDGGKTHLEAVKSVLSKMRIEDVQLLSISKGARRKSEMDSIHRINKPVMRIIKGSATHLFLQEIRDETHRFAITIQKKKQKKLSTSSYLDNLVGIGVQRKKLLIRYFGSVEQIKRASAQDLINVPGLGKKTAISIYNQLK
jgi:excinuclease ABC subunit C